MEVLSRQSGVLEVRTGDTDWKGLKPSDWIGSPREIVKRRERNPRLSSEAFTI